MGALYISKSKKKAAAEGASIVFGDEASFRQTPTLHQTWALRASQPHVPTKGQRHTQKILGAVQLFTGRFAYKHQTDYFNAESYIAFLEDSLLPSFYTCNHRVFLINDNASYHKQSEVYAWFNEHRKYIEVFLLPPYSPEFNAAERAWRHTRLHATHNRYFDTPEELCFTLFTVFEDMISHPDSVVPLIRSFF